MGDWTGTLISSLDAGAKFRGIDADMIRDIADALTGAMTPFTPTWTASAGTPAIGNGTLTGGYNRVGKTVFWTIDLTAGNTTTFGTAGAYWNFTIPVGTANGRWTGTAFVVDTAVLEYTGVWAIGYDSSTLISLFKPVSARFVNNSPFTFGSTDRLTATGFYLTT